MSTDERERLSRRSGRAARIYAVLLLLYPASYRRMFGEQMLQAFRDHFRDAVETEGEAEARFWAHMVGDASKSIVCEHAEALSERTWSMNKVVPAAWETVCIAAALVLVVAVVRFFHLNAFNPLLVGIPIYLALLFLVVRLARSIPLPVGTVSWWRLGLVLGGIIGLYMIALNLLDALAPIHGPQNSHGDNVGPVWLLTLPLLAGV